MRISDWSSDVCSSDLGAYRGRGRGQGIVERHVRRWRTDPPGDQHSVGPADPSGEGARPCDRHCARASRHAGHAAGMGGDAGGKGRHSGAARAARLVKHPLLLANALALMAPAALLEGAYGFRSEEHTSELQSLMRISDAV